jgi:hypothetical protein
MTITYVTGRPVEEWQKRIVQRIVNEQNLRNYYDLIKRALHQVPDPEGAKIDQTDGQDRPKTTTEEREERERELTIWDLYWLNRLFRREVNGRLG